MQIETWPINKLTAYINNPRKNDHAVEKVAEAIREFGFRVPVIAKSDGTVVDGHLRLKAAIFLGIKEIPVVLADDLTDAQVKAFRVSVNRMAELADWDIDILRLEIADLHRNNFDLSLTGLDEDVIKGFMIYDDQTVGLTDPDDIPDIPKKPKSKHGDVWVCGRNRIMCGDSTKLADVETLVGGGTMQMAFTDPPYNVSYQGKDKNAMTIMNDNMTSSDFYTFLSASFSNMAMVTAPGSAFYVCYADIETINFRRSLEASGWLVKQNLIWVKNAFVLGRQDYQWKHEPILYGWLSGASHRWHGDRKQPTIIETDNSVSVADVEGGHQISFSDGVNTFVFKVPSYELESSKDPLQTIWRVNKTLRNSEHPTMKPVELPRRAICNSTRNGESVLDLFSGAGSTLIACEETARRCFGMEFDPKYCDVIIKRWQQFTGKVAFLEADKTPFSEVAKDRKQ